MLESAHFILNIYMHYTTAYIRAAIGAVGIFLIFWLFRKILARLILKLASLSKSELADNLIKAFEIPLRSLFILIGIYLSLRYLPLSLGQDQFVYKVFRSLVIIFITWGFYDLAGTNSLLSDEMKYKLKIDTILIPFFSNLARFIIVALGIVLVANEWNFNVNGFVAGLGLGGLAFALAAKDVLANIFGGIVIILEKPFSIGDWILTPSVEGTVEDISFRSTRIRTFTQALVTVPNSTLANEAITNWSKMGKRRVSFYLAVNYSTPVPRLETTLERIRVLLRNQEDIHQDTINVALENLKESHVDILIQYFTITTDSAEHLKIRENLNLQIMQIFQEENIFIGLLNLPNRSLLSDSDLETR